MVSPIRFSSKRHPFPGKAYMVVENSLGQRSLVCVAYEYIYRKHITTYYQIKLELGSAIEP